MFRLAAHTRQCHEQRFRVSADLLIVAFAMRRWVRWTRSFRCKEAVQRGVGGGAAVTGAPLHKEQYCADYFGRRIEVEGDRHLPRNGRGAGATERRRGFGGASAERSSRTIDRLGRLGPVLCLIDCANCIHGARHQAQPF
ncbi:MAG: hypothetical protein EDS66_14345 [Planctomycetota bacterium]|nr:MAG: hypothetical protein EDS66_14345 [Planctomycetota bacterium]